MVVASVRLSEIIRILEISDHTHTQEEPLILFILRADGTSIYLHSFSPHIDLSSKMVKKFVSSFSKYHRNILRQQEIDPSILSIGEYNIRSVPIDSLTLFYVFKGDDDAAIESLIQFLDVLPRTEAWGSLTCFDPYITIEEKFQLDRLIDDIF